MLVVWSMSHTGPPLKCQHLRQFPINNQDQTWNIRHEAGFWRLAQQFMLIYLHPYHSLKIMSLKLSWKWVSCNLFSPSPHAVSIFVQRFTVQTSLAMHSHRFKSLGQGQWFLAVIPRRPIEKWSADYRKRFKAKNFNEMN